MLKDMGVDFDYPKPIDLIKYLIKISGNEDFIVLDSFAGSGSTAHAVLELNKYENKNLQFILVQIDELDKEGKQRNLCREKTAKRVTKAIKGVQSSRFDRIKEGTGGSFSYFELGDPIEMESILHGDNLPAYADLARYLFYTATGEEFDPKQLNEKKNFIGKSKDYEVYLFYKPDIDYLKSTALTLERAKALGKENGRKRLVFAPAKFVDTHTLLELRIEYCQLPFEIYKLKG